MNWTLRLLTAAFLTLAPVRVDAADLDGLRKMAEDGDAAAQYQLGEILATGEGAPQNFVAALQWLGMAAEQKEPRALYRVAAMMHEGEGMQRNMVQAGAMFQSAQKGLLELAQKGDLDAASKLGTLHTTGVLGKPDLEEGLKWIRQAAEKDWAKAQYDLAGHLLFGRGISPDKNKAMQWMTRSAKGGHPQAQFGLGAAFANAEGMRRDLKAAKEWLLKASRTGDPKLAGHAKQLLARVEAGDLRELPDVKVLAESAAKGVADAQYRLGAIHRDGVGMAQDYKKAAEFYEQAAKQGHALASYGLGGLLVGGLGVEKDAKAAYKWWLAAANRGLAVAQLDLGILLVKGEGAEKDNAEGYKWLTLAARAEEPRVKQRAIQVRDNLSRVMKGTDIIDGLRRARKFEPIKQADK